MSLWRETTASTQRPRILLCSMLARHRIFYLGCGFFLLKMNYCITLNTWTMFSLFKLKVPWGFNSSLNNFTFSLMWKCLVRLVISKVSGFLRSMLNTVYFHINAELLYNTTGSLVHTSFQLVVLCLYATKPQVFQKYRIITIILILFTEYLSSSMNALESFVPKL